MHVTLIGTAADIGGEGTVRTAVIGDPIEGEVAVLAVYYATPKMLQQKLTEAREPIRAGTEELP